MRKDVGEPDDEGTRRSTKAAERATECCMQLIELEQVDAVLEALLKASVNRIPKLALAATNAILAACGISARRKSSGQRHFEGLVPLFDAKDAGSRCGEGHHG